MRIIIDDCPRNELKFTQYTFTFAVLHCTVQTCVTRSRHSGDAEAKGSAGGGSKYSFEIHACGNPGGAGECVGTC